MAWNGGRGGGYPRGQQQQVVLPNAGDMGTLVVRGITAFARRNKLISGSYVLGLLVLLLIGSGTKLTIDQQRRYHKIMSTIDLDAEYQASLQFYNAQQAYYATKGWFFTCDSLCQRNKARMEEKRRILEEIRAEGYARMSDAKAVAGLWSEVGVGEVKDSFWKHFNSGHAFAKRQSMWDAFFIGIRSMSRDESMMEYIIRVLMQVLINFTMGLIMALVFFVVGLWSIVRSYQPNPMVAVIFFICAACAAFSFVVSYVLLIYGAAAGGVYSLVKLGESSARARLQQQQRQQPGYVYNRPHYH